MRASTGRMAAALLLVLAIGVGSSGAAVAGSRPDTALERLQRIVPAGDPRHHQIQSAHRIVRLARTINDPLERVVSLAEETSRSAAVSMGVALAPAPVPPSHRRATDAVVAFLAARNTPAPVEILQRLGTLAPNLDAALGRAVDAFAAFALARNPAAILSARLELVRAAAALSRARPSATPSDAGAGPLQVPGTLFLELEGSDTTYSADQNVQLSIDLGGNDTYLNTAGGTGGKRRDDYPWAVWCQSPFARAAAAIDLAGDDRYGDGSDCGRNGGAAHGLGFLFDGEGDDRYAGGSGGINGGGGGFLASGDGALFDVSGSDAYTAGSDGSNGGANNLSTAGTLIDGEGNDVYEAANGGANGGLYSSDKAGDSNTAFLVDGGGDDNYRAGGGGTNGGALAVGHIGRGGSAALLDAGGDDRYVGGADATNGGVVASPYWCYICPGVKVAVTGLLFDGGGNDRFAAGRSGTNGGGMTQGGDMVAGNGGGALVDLSGDDIYVAAGTASNGGAPEQAISAALNPAYWNTYLLVSFGLLFDGDGTDSYRDPAIPGGAATDCTLVGKEGSGIQFDTSRQSCE